MRRPPKTSSSQQVLGSRENKQQFGAWRETQPAPTTEKRLRQEMQRTPQSICNLEKSCKPPLSSCCRSKTMVLEVFQSQNCKILLCLAPMWKSELQQGRKGVLKTSISTLLPFGLSIFQAQPSAPLRWHHARTCTQRQRLKTVPKSKINTKTEKKKKEGKAMIILSLLKEIINTDVVALSQGFYLQPQSLILYIHLTMLFWNTKSSS